MNSLASMVGSLEIEVDANLNKNLVNFRKSEKDSTKLSSTIFVGDLS